MISVSSTVQNKVEACKILGRKDEVDKSRD